MTDKEKYRIFCPKELTIPVYSRDWWLDCVCGENNWNVLLYYHGDEIEAAMPIYSPVKKVILMPEKTQTLGIWFNPKFENLNYSKNLYRKQTICNYFIDNLPLHNYFLQKFHYSFTDWLPFYWKGFKQTTRYNYILPDILNSEKLWNDLGENIKRNINKAKKKYNIEIRKSIPIKLFLQVNNKTYERQKMSSYHPEMLQKMIEISRSKNQGETWGAFDKEGRLHAAVFIVWQENCAYYIAGGGDPELRNSGAHAFVLWQAICDVAEYSYSFDFEGSMIQGVERFFREFGAKQIPFFEISKGRLSLIKRLIMKIEYLLKNKPK
ncbi:MAG: GNAT family N-acetyltransferase [Bacteroidales bacterium]|nr:GNAT family N-acetyltransferase [Bacteroidales bacterium]